MREEREVDSGSHGWALSRIRVRGIIVTGNWKDLRPLAPMTMESRKRGN